MGIDVEEDSAPYNHSELQADGISTTFYTASNIILFVNIYLAEGEGKVPRRFLIILVKKWPTSPPLILCQQELATWPNLDARGGGAGKCGPGLVGPSQHEVSPCFSGSSDGKKSACNILASLSIYIGEGNGTPLQYSCLENPIDGGAWWAAVHGVAQSHVQP